MREPFEGIGKPEALKYMGPGIWSRRITKQDRLVYIVEDDASFRKSVVRLIKASGFETEDFESANSFLTDSLATIYELYNFIKTRRTKLKKHEIL